MRKVSMHHTRVLVLESYSTADLTVEGKKLRCGSTQEAHGSWKVSDMMLAEV
jgi:hypothetical protein